MCFRKIHPRIIIGKKAFDAQYPSFAKKMKDCNVYYCIYHVELDELQQGLNHMRMRLSIHSEAQCDYTCDNICEPTIIEGSNACTNSFIIYHDLLYYGNQLFVL
jgi:hypothetical protein